MLLPFCLSTLNIRALITVVCRVWPPAVPALLIYVCTRDDGTLVGRFPGLRVRQPDS